MSFVPNGVEADWKLDADAIKELTDKIIKKAKQVYDEVGALKKEDVTVENAILKLTHEEYEYSVQSTVVDFPQHMAEGKEIRTASTDGDKLLSQLSVELSMRQDVFNNLVALKEKGLTMTAEQTRYLDRMIRSGKRNGLHLGTDIQDEVKRIKTRISDLEIEFSKNCNEENTVLEFTEDELCGLPEDFLTSLEKSEDGSKLRVTLKYPHYFPCIRNARNPDTRKTLLIAFNRRCIDENTPILEELVELRHKKAKLLGYETHADFVTEILMAKTGLTVKNFLADLSKKMRPLGDNDIQLMLKMKKEECAKLATTFDEKINYWDLRYYMNMIEKEHYSVDHEKIKEYFPMDVVTKGLLEIYQELLSLRFELIPNAEVWHPDVTMYNVIDSASDKLMGYFYLDLYPRDGKFGHAACFGIQPAALKGDGSRSLSIGAMLANLPKPTANKPSLLTHDDVETFFHEFGHVMHRLCAETDMSRFSGTSVERDFVEAPSQMLENWIWEKEALKRISCHYEDKSKLSDDIIDTLIKSRNANTGVFNLRQILLGTFDLTIHTQAKADTAAIFTQLSEEILHVPQAEGTNMTASFGHMCGYDARYYGYLWSEVFSMDMFSSCFKEQGIFNKEVGMKYRNCILKPGGSVDATELIRNFLGREPNERAFLISKGLEVES